MKSVATPATTAWECAVAANGSKNNGNSENERVLPTQGGGDGGGRSGDKTVSSSSSSSAGAGRGEAAGAIPPTMREEDALGFRGEDGD